MKTQRSYKQKNSKRRNFGVGEDCYYIPTPNFVVGSLLLSESVTSFMSRLCHLCLPFNYKDRHQHPLGSCRLIHRWAGFRQHHFLQQRWETCNKRNHKNFNTETKNNFIQIYSPEVVAKAARLLKCL